MSRMMFSICLIIIGVLLLLINIGVISLEIKELFVAGYPFLFLLYGLISLYYIFLKRKDNVLFTIFILTFSTLLILDRFRVIEFGFMDFWKIWPILIILIALWFLKPRKLTIQFESKNHEEKKHKKRLSFRIVLKEYPTCKVIIITSFYDEAQVIPAIEAGAFSYLLKTASATQVVEAINKAYAGETVIEPKVANVMVKKLRQ